MTAASPGWRITRLPAAMVVPAAALTVALVGCSVGDATRPGAGPPASPETSADPARIEPPVVGAPPVSTGAAPSSPTSHTVVPTTSTSVAPLTAAATTTAAATPSVPTTTAAPLPSTTVPSTSVRQRRSDVRVTDGDTFEIVLGGVVERVRLVGVNAPEAGECLADQATEALDQLLGTAADLELTLDESDRDQYGRLLRHVQADGVWVNAELVRQGLAVSRAYPPDTTRQDGLDAAQAEARAAGAGMWSPAACGPPSAATLVVSAIAADPPGDDTAVLVDEWVEITNAGSAPIDLTGWGLKDESARHRYSFPARFVLAAGAAVRVRSGCGADTVTDLFWCARGSAIWNNAGDTVYVLDPRGNIVVSRTYDG